MPHDLTQYDFELPDIDDAFAGESRTLAFKVTDADGNGVDIDDATVRWMLAEREYQTETADAVLDGSDADVELVTDSRVDTSNGEWEVRLDSGALEDIWGEYHHRPEVEHADGSQVQWRGTIIVTA